MFIQVNKRSYNKYHMIKFQCYQYTCSIMTRNPQPISGADPGILKTGGAKISLALNPAGAPWLGVKKMAGGEENGWGRFSAQKKGGARR